MRRLVSQMLIAPIVSPFRAARLLLGLFSPLKRFLPRASVLAGIAAVLSVVGLLIYGVSCLLDALRPRSAEEIERLQQRAYDENYFLGCSRAGDDSFREETYDYKEAMTLVRIVPSRLSYDWSARDLRWRWGRERNDAPHQKPRLRICFFHQPEDPQRNPWFYAYFESREFNGHPEVVARSLKRIGLHRDALVTHHLGSEQRPTGEGEGYVSVRKTPGVHVLWPLPMSQDKLDRMRIKLQRAWASSVDKEAYTGPKWSPPVP